MFIWVYFLNTWEMLMSLHWWVCTLERFHNLGFIYMFFCLFVFFSKNEHFAFSIGLKLVFDLLSILGTCHVSRAFGLEARAAQTRPFWPSGTLQKQTTTANQTSNVTTVCFVIFSLHAIQASRLYWYFYTVGVTHAYTMTREEDLIRIAKKLDKMVSRNNTVRVILTPASRCCFFFFSLPFQGFSVYRIWILVSCAFRRAFVYF